MRLLLIIAGILAIGFVLYWAAMFGFVMFMGYACMTGGGC
jgi:hypothetical protein